MYCIKNIRYIRFSRTRYYLKIGGDKMIKITESGSDYIKIEKNKFLKIRLTKTPDPDFANTYTYTAEVKKQYSTPILNQSDNLKNFDSDLQYFKEIGNRLYIESWIALSEDYFKFTYSVN